MRHKIVASPSLVLVLMLGSASFAFASDILGDITVAPAMSRKTTPPAIYDLRGVAASGHAPKQTKGASNSPSFGRVAVWLERGPGRTAPPTVSTMRQQELHFEPELIIIPAGSKIDFPNLDPVFHNVFSLSRSQSFDLGYYSEGKSKQILFPNEGIVQVYCHVHPEMYGVIIVTSSRWVARPDDNGAFSLSGVPPGKHRLVVWQRSAGLVHRNIDVPVSGSLQVHLKLPEESDTP